LENNFIIELKAITTKAEDARIVIEIGNLNDSKLRFILLNPAEKLREIVSECHSLILLGGTMRPIDQLLDGFKKVCGIKEERILQFSCGHVICPEQLMAISIGWLIIN
jgi:chromosome transmission fidelity protein 1